MDALPRHDIGIGKTVTTPFEATVARVEAALKEQGFGILTRIDMKETLKAKLGVDIDPQVILGACHPPLAYKAITAEPRIALLLPCNVVVRKEKLGVRVESIEPYAMVELFPEKDLRAVAAEASDRIHRAIESL